jgi:hypothetical protein
MYSHIDASLHYVLVYVFLQHGKDWSGWLLLLCV